MNSALARGYFAACRFKFATDVALVSRGNSDATTIRARQQS
jgi:hypothetical protein